MWESVLGGKISHQTQRPGTGLTIFRQTRPICQSRINIFICKSIVKQKVLNFLQAGRLWVPVTRARENVSKNVLYHDFFKITNHNNFLYLLIANGRFHFAYRALLSSSDNHDHDPCTINLCGQVATQQMDKGVSSPCTKTADCSLSPFDPCFKPQ